MKIYDGMDVKLVRDELGTDARKWAEAFLERLIDEGQESTIRDTQWVTGWFANAMEAVRDDDQDLREISQCLNNVKAKYTNNPNERERHHDSDKDWNDLVDTYGLESEVAIYGDESASEIIAKMIRGLTDALIKVHLRLRGLDGKEPDG